MNNLSISRLLNPLLYDVILFRNTQRFPCCNAFIYVIIYMYVAAKLTYEPMIAAVVLSTLTQHQKSNRRSIGCIHQTRMRHGP